MVRLKVSVASSFTNDNKISIPYGAIKSSAISNNCAIIKFISIPYGAIKSTVVYTHPTGF